MTRVPLPCLYLPATPGRPKAWDELQSALGAGLCTVELTVPETLSSPAGWRNFQTHGAAPPRNENAVAASLQQLLKDWHVDLSNLLCQRWDLSENPFARAWLLPGMILLHEDPLGWALDTVAQSLGTPAAQNIHPHWALLMPMPLTAHERLKHRGELPLPHAGVLNAALTHAAKIELHHALGDLTWQPACPFQGNAPVQ